MAFVTAPPQDVQLRELTTLLWDYRSKLDRVEFLLEAQLLFSGAQRTGRLDVIASLLDETATGMAELDLYREVLLSDLGPEPVSLRTLADAVSDPWSTILHDHHVAFSAIIERIELLVDQCRLTMDATLGSLNRVIEFTGQSTVDGYDASGDRVRSRRPAVLFAERA